MYGATSADVVPAGGVEAAEDPAVDLLQRLRVLLLDERLERGEEAHHRHAGEDQRGRAAPGAGRAAEQRTCRRRRSSAAGERDERDQVVASRRRRARRRSRSSRRGRRRRRCRAGTGRRAGCGRRPGRTRRRAPACRRRAAPSTTRGARSCQRIALVGPARGSSGRAGTAGARRPTRDRAERRRAPGPTSRPTSARRAGRATADASGRRVRGAEGTRTASPPAGLDAAPRSLAPRRRPCAHLAATARMKSTIRGPQREAMSSLTPTTPPFLTAAIVLQPGRASTLAAVCPQHFVSARTIRSGSAATMYSAESFG